MRNHTQAGRPHVTGAVQVSANENLDGGSGRRNRKEATKRHYGDKTMSKLCLCAHLCCAWGM